MQINFTPHKIKASKAYIENLCKDEKEIKKVIKREQKLSFFQRLKKIFRLL